MNIFCRIVIATTLGSTTAGRAIAFTSDYISAKISAGRLFKLFDRKSAIDVNDEQGEYKVRFHIFTYMCFLLIMTVQVRL